MPSLIIIRKLHFRACCNSGDWELYHFWLDLPQYASGSVSVGREGLYPQPCGSFGARASHLSSSLSMDENQRHGVQIRVILPTCLLPTHLSLHLIKGGFKACNIYLLVDSVNWFKINPTKHLLHYMLLDVVYLHDMVIGIWLLCSSAFSNVSNQQYVWN